MKNKLFNDPTTNNNFITDFYLKLVDFHIHQHTLLNHIKNYENFFKENQEEIILILK